MSDRIEPPPSWKVALEVRAVGERVAMELATPFRRLLPHGDGHHVLVLPGFSADDRSTRPLRDVLGDLGYHTHGWKLGQNLGPTPAIREGLSARFGEIHRRAGAPVSIVGWSLGGIFAREIARGRPDQVRQVITLGSPIQMIRSDASSAQPRYDSLRHLHDPAAERKIRAAFRPPLDVPSTSIYSRTDGVVSWQASLVKRTSTSENIRVIGSHCGLGFNNAAVFAISDRLAQPPGVWRHFSAPLLLRAFFPPADDLDPTKLPTVA